MIVYLYKGFKISYEITSEKIEKSNYKANGSVAYLLNRPKSFPPKQFHTEHNTPSGAEHEIKKLLENYVNFELKNCYNIKNKNVGRVQPSSQVKMKNRGL